MADKDEGSPFFIVVGWVIVILVFLVLSAGMFSGGYSR